ncbi:hypothetical protein BJ741DRAFT_621349 [Chytriomyces cf. hyalinus JEL632]|nr:hypothetical protein BJ741DRAFT_621349 [Chytriomyces cf. hyalinus JEL632]
MSSDQKDLVALGRQRLKKFQRRSNNGSGVLSAASSGSTGAVDASGGERASLDFQAGEEPDARRASALEPQERIERHEVVKSREASLDNPDTFLSLLLDEKASLLALNKALHFELDSLTASLADERGEHNSHAQKLLSDNKALRDQLAALSIQLDNERALNFNDSKMTANLDKIAYQTSLIAQMEKELETIRSAAPTPTMIANASFKVEGQLSDLQTQLAQKHEALEDAFAQIADLQSRTSIAESSVAASQQQTASLQSANENLAAQLEDALTRIHLLSQESSSSSQLADNSQKEMDSLLAQHEKDLTALKETHEAVVSEKESSVASISRLLDMQKQEHVAVSDRLTVAERRITELLVDNKALMHQLSELRQAQIGVQNERAALVDELHNAQSRVKKLLVEVDMLEGLKEEARLLKEIVRTGGTPTVATFGLNGSSENSKLSLASVTTYENPNEFIGAMNESMLDQALSPVQANSDTHVKLDAPVTAEKGTEHAADTNTGVPSSASIPATPDQEALLQQLRTNLESCEREIKDLRQLLGEERHRTELLAAELECIPDYIHLYHKERKLLKSKAATTNATSPSRDAAKESAMYEEQMPQMKRPAELRGLVGGNQDIVCGPCPDCSDRVFVL